MMIRKNLFQFVKKYQYVLTLVFIAILSHLQWFNLNSILNFGDWTYWPNEATKQLFNSWGAWINFFNFGAVNIRLNFNFFTSIWSLLANLGFSYNLATKITLLIPIAILGFIAPYIFFKKLIKNEIASFAVALFYGTTTYFLIQTGEPPIAFVYALTPLIFYFFIRALEANKIANWLIFVLIYWISSCYEIRITYVVTFLLFLYFIFFHVSDIKKYWKNILLSIVVFLGLNIFWLLPTIFGGLSGAILAVANRGLFGNWLFDLGHSFALYESAWTGGYPNMEFVSQPIIWYFWLIPIIAFSAFLFYKKNKYKKEIIFWGIISLIGIFLTKQTAEPLTGIYLWLYNNFPGFNLFREASKFYLITAIGYAGLLGYGLLVLKEHKNKILNKYIFSIFSIIIISIALWNVKPLITGEIGTMFVPRPIPQDYLILKDFILKQPEYFRTFWAPTASTYGIYTNQKPVIGAIAMIGNELGKYTSSVLGYDNLPVNEQIAEILKTPNTNDLFDNSSIKYVIVPIRDIINDDAFINYGADKNPNIRQWYIDRLDQISWLKKINIGTKDLVVYENENYRPHIYTTTERETIYGDVPYEKVESQQENPTKYTVYLSNITVPVYLNFSESFDVNWKVRTGDFSWYNVFNKNYFLPDRFHSESDATLNSFYVDPNYIRQNLPASAYKVNSDGSIDLDLTLYFKPQSYFYLGLIISGATLFACLGYLAFSLFHRKKKLAAIAMIKKEENV